MKAFLMAVVAALAIAVVWAVVLEKVQQPASGAFTTQGVRL